MLKGIGVDLIEIYRIEKACLNKRFIEKYFTEEEIKLAKGNTSFFAGNFASKEAFSKAVGTGFRGFEPIDIEVLRDDIGKPYIKLYKGARKAYEDLLSVNINISISNTKDYAVAFVILE